MELFAYSFCPIGNKWRILLKQNNIDFEHIVVNNYKDYVKYSEFLLQLPYIKFENKKKIIFINNSVNFYNFLKDTSGTQNFLVNTFFADIKVQNLEFYFDSNFFHQIFYALLRFDLKNDDSFNCSTKIADFCDFWNKHFVSYDWAQSDYTINDISLFTSLAMLDHYQQIRWYDYKNLKNFYSKISSKKEFQFIFRSS